MPPIVIDGKTTNKKNLIQDIRAIAKSSFSVKHTNHTTTVLFINEKFDHEKVLANKTKYNITRIPKQMTSRMHSS